MNKINKIKTVPNVLVFDSKNDENYNILNKTDELEQILSDSPVVYNNQFIGAIGHCQNRSGTTLYFAEIYLTQDIGDFSKLKVVRQRLQYRYLNDKDVFVDNVITEVDKIEN
jgi:hypothetical protein